MKLIGSSQASKRSRGSSQDHCQRAAFEAVDGDPVTDKGKTQEGTVDWSRNFTEGIRRMIRTSPGCPPRAIYLTDGDSSKGKHSLQEIYPSTEVTQGGEIFPLIASDIVSDIPEIPEAEIEQTFCQVWTHTKECMEVLANFIVNNLHHVFDKDRFIDCRHPDTFFIAPEHKNYVIKAELYGLFLANFESQSFGISTSDAASGALKFGAADAKFDLEPKVRALRFYQSFKAQSMETDVDYIEWFGNRVKLFYDMFQTKMVGWISSLSAFQVDTESLLQTMGGPYLASYVKAVAAACWNLQTLAFAFEGPATRFRVEDGDEFDETCMIPVVDIENDEFTGERDDLVVSFMVAPGFNFGASFIPAQVYLIAVDPEISELSL